MQPGWAVDGGLQTGDLISKVDDEDVVELADFRKTWEVKVAAKPSEIVLTVIRGEANERVLVRIECVW